MLRSELGWQQSPSSPYSIRIKRIASARLILASLFFSFSLRLICRTVSITTLHIAHGVVGFLIPVLYGADSWLPQTIAAEAGGLALDCIVTYTTLLSSLAHG